MIFLKSKGAKVLFLCLCFLVIGFTVLFVYQSDTCTLEQRVLRSLTVDQAQRLVTIFNAQYSPRQIHRAPVQSDIEHRKEHGDSIDDSGISDYHYGADISVFGENHVLLNSYMRSGSSFMGRVLGFRDDVFYYYEPLWTENIWTYHKGVDQMCSTTTPRCSKRPDELRISRRILENIYTCHLRNIGSKFSEKVHAGLGLAGELSWKPYHTCKEMKPRDKRYCLKVMEDICRNRTTRVTKVLRIDLTLADLILQDNPHLKIVHLFRDPRGTMSSHVFTKWFPTKIDDIKAINMDAQVYCERVKVDILAAISLHEKYPDRLRGIQYEDFYNLKEKAKLLYDYLGMDSSEKYLDFVLRQFSTNTKYNTTETNASKLFAYRSTLPWYVVQIVEKQCADVISLLGLKLFETEANYRDQNFSPIDGQLRFGLSQI